MQFLRIWHCLLLSVPAVAAEEGEGADAGADAGLESGGPLVRTWSARSWFVSSKMKSRLAVFRPRHFLYKTQALTAAMSSIL